MQDPKKINVTNGVVSNGKIYSLEFHEDNHDANMKVTDQGVSTYYPISGGGGGNGGTTVTHGYLSGNSPATVYTGGSTPASSGYVVGDWTIDLDTSNIWYLANANTNTWVQSQAVSGGGSGVKTFEYWEHTSNLSQSIPANTGAILYNDGLGLNSSSSKGVLFDGQNFDFSSLSVGSVVNITIQFGSIDNPAGAGLNHEYDVFFRHQTSNGLKRFPFVTNASTGNGGRPVFATITIPIIDEDMKQGGAQLDVMTSGAISIYNNFISITVL